MKPHQRNRWTVSAIVLLAVVVGFSFSHKKRETPAGRNTMRTVSGNDVVAAAERPEAISLRREGMLATKVSQRQLQPVPAMVEGREREIDQPRPGEPTYRLDNLPKTSGTYWVENPNGGFGRLSVRGPSDRL